MDKWKGKVALVTGASSGIGAAISCRLVKHGLHVIGCARRLDKIQELKTSLKDASGSLEALQCDLSQEDQILSVFRHIEDKYGGLDICVNNGGVGLHASLLEGKTEDWRQILDVNVLALMICTREAVKIMKKNDVPIGHIIHIGSIAGHVGPTSPEANTYYTSKHAVRAITEGHRTELRAINSNIKVTAISPGWVETGFSNQMRGEELMKEIYGKSKCLQSTDIADAVDYVLSTPQHVQVHDIMVRPGHQEH